MQRGGEIESRSDRDDGPARSRFSTVYIGRATWATRLARGFAADAHEAEDVVQDAFLWLWLRQGGEVGLDPRSLLAVIVRRLGAKSYQRRSRVRAAGLMEETSASLREGATSFEEKDEVASLLVKLDEEERQVVRMRYLEGKSCEEVATRIRVAPGTVHSRLFRALAKLRVLAHGRPSNSDRNPGSEHVRARLDRSERRASPTWRVLEGPVARSTCQANHLPERTP